MSRRLYDLYQKGSTTLDKLSKGGFYHLFGSSVINKVLSFMSSVIIVRLIPKSEYGVYSNADNILGMFCLLEGFGMVTTFLQFGCTNTGEKKQQIWRFCFWFSVIFQCILSISIFIASLTAKFSIPGTGYLLMLMSFLPIPRLVRDMQQVYLRTECKNQAFAYSNTFSTAVTVVLSCGLSVFFLEKGLIAATYISSIATIIYIVKVHKVSLPVRVKGSLPGKEKKKILKFATVCVINNSTSSVMYLLDTFILGIVVATSTVTASYKVATKIPTALNFIPVCVMTYIYPKFAQKKDDKQWCYRNYKKVLAAFGIFNLLSVGTLIMMAPIVIKLVFGAQYMDCLIPFRLLCVNYIIQATFGTVSGQLLVSQEKLRMNTIVGFGSSILNTCLNLWLIPIFSSTGAAIATLVVTCLSSLVTTIYLWSTLKK